MARIFEEVVNTKTLTRDEWLLFRQAGIGGSDIAAILGMSRYTSRRILWLEKSGLKPLDDLSDSEAVYWGNVHEETVAQEFARRSGMRVRRYNAMLARKDKPFMLANVDRLIIGKKEGLECKTAHEYKKGEWSAEEIPTEYFLQCQWYMAVTGFERWHIAALIGGNKFFTHVVERDDELIALMEKEAADFWNREVLGGEPPAWEGSAAEGDYLSAQFGEAIADPEAHVEIGEAYVPVLEKLETVKEQIDELKKEQAAMENELKEKLGPFQVGFVGDRMVTWKSFEQKRLDSKRIKEEAPELYERYCKKSVSRKFTIK